MNPNPPDLTGAAVFIEMPEWMRQAATVTEHRPGRPDTAEGIMLRGLPTDPIVLRTPGVSQ